MSDYSYKLDVFEGPLDLLLHLIEKHKIEIYDIPIVEITSQYLSYLDNWNHFDIHYSSEFLVMASTLLQIKSRMLLPKVTVENEEEEDPRDELVSRLVEFKQIKELTSLISEKSEQYNTLFSRPEELSLLGIEKVYTFELSQLYKIFKSAYEGSQKKELPPPKVKVEKESYNLDLMMSRLRDRVLNGEKLYFSTLLENSKNKSEMVTIFLAILELLRQQDITLVDDLENNDIILQAIDHREDPQNLLELSMSQDDSDIYATKEDVNE